MKAATGLMTKPVFPLVWGSKPVSPDVQARIQPSRYSSVNDFGTALFANNLLSYDLRRILHVLRDVAFYSQAYHERPTTLRPEDYDFFRIVSCEVEHQLLSYVYPGSEKTRALNPEPTFDLHPIEAVVRTASICYLNLLLIISPSSCGIGRALTKNLKKVASKCTLPTLSRLPKENYMLFAWAMFIGVQGSTGQVEHDWFIEKLAHAAMVCGWYNWEQASSQLADYLYIPDVQGSIWKSIWDQVVALLIPDMVGAC